MITIPANSSRLLSRQLKKAFPDGRINADSVNAFVALVNEAYLANEDAWKFYNRAEKIANKELEEVNKELQTKNDFLDTFNHGMAHDIKNHTSNIIGLVSMLHKYHARKDAGMLDSIIEKLDVSASQLTAIVQGFLYLSRAEANIDNQFEIINPQQIIDAIKAETLFLTVGKQCTINYRFDIDDLFFSNHVLKIIFVNLISNSIKFSRKDVPVVITARLQQRPGEIELTVEDNGRGMNLNDPNNKLFSLFNRMDSAKTVKGTGIGLFMVKKIVDRHRGRVNVTSELNKGTTFSIVISLN